MAPVVGVPKRERCKQCGEFIFFAERLAVDGACYHRKCLRCARCDSQLTPGSFYETEVDGVFCCETCPDEEKKLQRFGTNNNNNDGTADDGDDDSSGNRNRKNSNSSAIEHQLQPLSPSEQRQSFSEKLAMFQTNGTGGLLQKSLSDEEKSKSLKRLTELYSKNAQQQPTTIDEIIEKSSVEVAKTPATSSESSDDSDEDDENDIAEQPPALPRTAPPEPCTNVQTELPQVIKPKLPPIPSKANVLNKIHAKMNGGSESPIKLAIAINKRPRSTSRSSIDNDKQQRDSHHNSSDEHDESSSNVIAPTTQHLQSQNNENEATVAVRETTTTTTSTDNKDDVNTTIEGGVVTKENRLPFDALNSLINVTKENDATVATEQAGKSSQRHAVNAHCLDDDHIKCDGVTMPHIDDNTNIGSHTIESRANVVDKNPVLDTNQEIDDNNANSDTHHIDKSVDSTNEMDDITMRRELQQQQQPEQTSSIRDNDRQNVVRSRLSQFEALLQTTTKTPSPRHSPRFQRRNDDIDHASKQRKKSIDTDVFVIDKLLAQNTLTTTPTPTAAVDDPAKAEKIEREPNKMDIQPEIAINQLSPLDDNDVNDLQQQPSNAVSDEIALDPCHDDSSDAKNKPVPRQRVTLNASCLNDDDDDDDVMGRNQPIPCKRRQKTPSIDAQSVQHNDHLKNHSENGVTGQQNEANYPNVLNPFGSDDEQQPENEENEERGRCVANTKPMDNSNPFDSSDDEIELLKLKGTSTPPTKRTPYKSYR